MLIVLAVIIIVTIIIYTFMLQAKFGSKPTGHRLQTIQSSANYRSGQFQNLNLTPQLTEGASFARVPKAFMFGKKPERRPSQTLPWIKTNLHELRDDPMIGEQVEMNNATNLPVGRQGFTKKTQSFTKFSLVPFV